MSEGLELTLWTTVLLRECIHMLWKRYFINTISLLHVSALKGPSQWVRLIHFSSKVNKMI